MSKSNKWQYLLVLFLISAILVLAAYIYYNSETKEIRKEKNETLSTINHLKLNQFIEWKTDITGQTKFFTTIGQLIKYTDWLIKNPDNKEAQNYFIKTFKPLKERRNFETIFICDKGGKLLFSLDSSFEKIDSVTAANIKSSAKGDSLVFGDFYYNNNKKQICLDITTPIRDNNNRIIGTYTQIIFPEHFLYPMIHDWPLETRTGETLLAKKLKDRVVFLSELRFKDNSMLNQYVPLSDTETVVVKGTMGKRGIIEGRDYRGAEVLAELKPVPGTKWYLISKIDKSEIYSEILFRTETIIIIVVILILAIIFGFLYFYKARQSNIYKELLSKEEEFKATLYSIGDGVITTDRRGSIKQMNAVAEMLTGWKESRARGKKLSEVFVIINELTKEKVENPVEEVIKTGKRVSLANHTLLISRKGEEVPIADSGAPIKDDKGNIIGVVLVFRNQTKERAKEKALFESNEKFSKIFHHSSDSISLTQLSTGKLSEVNEKFEKVFGYSRSEAIGKTTFELGLWANPADRDRMIKLLKQNGYIKDFEAVGNRRDGKQITALLSGEILEFHDDQYLLLSLKDITERKQIEKTLIENEERLRLSLHAANQGMYDINIQTDKVVVNDEYALMLGYDPKTFVEKSENWSKKLHPDDYEKWEKAYRDYIAGKTDEYKIEFRLKTKKNDWKWILSSGKIVEYDNDGKPLRMLGTHTDITEKKLVEEELKKSELLFRTLAEHSPVGIFKTDPAGSTTYVNPFWCRLSELSFEEAIGDGWLKAVHPEDKKLLAEKWREATVNNQISNAEYRFLLPDGTIKWVIGSAVPLKNSDGSIQGYLGTITDITGRKNSEEILKASEAKLASIFRAAPTGIGVVVNRIIKEVNDRICEMTGYSKEELIGKSSRILYPSDEEFDMVGEKKYGLIKKFGGGTVETKWMNKSGQVLDILLSSTPINISDLGKGVTFTALDISERKQAELTLRKLSQAVEQSNVSIIITNKDGIIEYANPKFTQVSGYNIQEVYGKNPRILKSGYQDKEFYKGLWDTILSGKDWQGEMQNRKKNGELFWEQDIISPIFNETGNITHFVAVKEDITEKKKMLEELVAAKEHAEEMNRAKSSFFANMSHELRTPFVGIIGFAELLEEALLNPEEKEYASKIVQSAKRLTDTLNKILNISRLESTGYEVYLSPVNVNELVREIGGLFIQYANSNNTVLKIEAEFDDKEIETDKKLIEEILNNLLNNSVRFTKNGEIKIKTEKIVENEEDLLRLTVSDTGIGVPKEKQAIIWQEFRQASEGLSRSFEGTGLGLTLTKKYVELLGGTIMLESEENKGTTFTIDIPVVYAKSVKTKDAESSRKNLSPSESQFKHKAKILFVDDDKIACYYIKKVLNNLYKLDIVNSGDEALSSVKKNSYDILLIDINLGRGIDGLELMQTIKKLKNYSSTPVVAVTAYASKSDKDEFLSKGFTHYLSKPFTSSELKDLLAEILT